MAYELTKNLLGNLIKQQRDAETMQQTPEFQTQVDKMFANRIEFARNQLVYERIANARDSNELLEAIKTVSPDLYMKKKKEEFVGAQIMDELSTKSEQQRDYGLINYLASTLGYGDVGPIEKRPMPKSVEQQAIRIKEAGDRYYTGASTDKLREQREYLFAKQFLDRGIMYNGKPATNEQISKFQEEYLKTGSAPEGFTIAAEPVKPQKVQRPTKDQMSQAYDQAIELIDIERDNIGKSKEAKFLWMGTDKEGTFKNLLALDESELDKLKISKRLKDFIKLFKTYGLPEGYIQEGSVDPSEHLNQPVQFDPNDPLEIFLE